MKISNSKKELARIISENGGWRDKAEWATQDNVVAFFSGGKPDYVSGDKIWYANGDDGMCIVAIDVGARINSFHNTILSRAEYFHLHPAPDADGWIEWLRDELPVEKGVIIDVKYSDGDELHSAPCGIFTANMTSIRGECASAESFGRGDGSFVHITAYRLHKPEQANPEFCESVTRSISEPESKPTIEQLATDYRNKLDYANRKQDEAEKAKVESDAALSELENAIAAIGFAITPIDAVAQYPELVITDWRDLMIGDVIEYVDGDIKDKIGMTGPVVEFAPDATDGMHVILKCDNGPNKGRLGWPRKWRFIRRPAK